MRIHSDLPFKWRMHQKVCSPWNANRCPSCPMIFHNKSALTRHRKVHRQWLYTETIPNPDKPSERQFICKSCPFITNARDKMHLRSIGTAMQCVRQIGEIAMHEDTSHTAFGRTQSFCACIAARSKRFKNQYQMSIHERSHRKERNFKTSNEMAMHRKRHFTKVTPFCKMCSKEHKSKLFAESSLNIGACGFEVDAKDAVALAGYGYTKHCMDIN